MTRLLMLVEGQSEEIFVKQTLTPHLADHGVFVQPIVLWTKRLGAGGGYRGGVSNWNQIKRSLLPLTFDTDAWITTLLDFYGLPEDVPESLIRKECWTRTGKALVLSVSPAELKTLPLGTSLYADASLLCTVQLAKDGLWIEPSAGTQVSLQRASDDKVVPVVCRQPLKSDSRSGVSFWLHLGTIEEEHAVWRFNW